ncbi:unnamed protein product, partial [Prorocentrum cordatum]
ALYLQPPLQKLVNCQSCPARRETSWQHRAMTSWRSTWRLRTNRHLSCRHMRRCRRPWSMSPSWSCSFVRLETVSSCRMRSTSLRWSSCRLRRSSPRCRQPRASWATSPRASSASSPSSTATISSGTLRRERLSWRKLTGRSSSLVGRRWGLVYRSWRRNCSNRLRTT